MGTSPAANRMDWVDVLKGLGILSVAAYHVVGNESLPITSLITIPLFFVLSGYLFRPRPDLGQYLIDKSINLLVPYLAFLILLHGPEWIDRLMHDGPVTLRRTLRLLLKPLAGGRRVSGTLIVFWFITALFAAQQVMNLMLTRWSPRTVGIVAGAFLVIGYVQQALAPRFWLPWALELLPATIPMLYAGYVLRRQDLGRLMPYALVLSFAAVILIHRGFNVMYDLKFINYGIPGVTFVGMVSCMIVLLWSAPWIDRSRWVAAPLKLLGAASLTIMYLHYPTYLLQTKYFGWMQPSLSLVVAVLVPLGLHFLFQTNGVTRAFLLGSKQDLLRLFGRRGIAGARPTAYRG